MAVAVVLAAAGGRQVGEENEQRADGELAIEHLRRAKINNRRRAEPALGCMFAQTAAGRIHRLHIIAAHRIVPQESWCDELCISVDEPSLNEGAFCFPHRLRNAKSSLMRPEGRIAAGGQSALRAATAPRI